MQIERTLQNDLDLSVLHEDFLKDLLAIKTREEETPMSPRVASQIAWLTMRMYEESDIQLLIVREMNGD